MSSQREETARFLRRARELIRQGRFLLVPRSRNLQSLAELGLTLRDAREEILILREENWYAGPKPDYAGSGEIWEFKTRLEDVQVYIKLRIAGQGRGEQLRCLSFHEDDFGPGRRRDCGEDGEPSGAGKRGVP